MAPGRGARVGPLKLVDADAPTLPAAGWHRVRPRLAGICGSDLATVDGMSSREFEPTACAVHAAAAHSGVGVTVVLGAGTIGLCTLAALSDLDVPLVAVAKHPEQRRLARSLGATTVCEPSELPGVVRRLTRSMQI